MTLGQKTIPEKRIRGPQRKPIHRSTSLRGRQANFRIGTGGGEGGLLPPSPSRSSPPHTPPLLTHPHPPLLCTSYYCGDTPPSQVLCHLNKNIISERSVFSCGILCYNNLYLHYISLYYLCPPSYSITFPLYFLYTMYPLCISVFSLYSVIPFVFLLYFLCVPFAQYL